jgi:phosphatidylglycerophosphate synthase
MATFKELLQASLKSNDTEEWLDVHFTRPIGLVFALFWNRLGIHPNVITMLSIFLGAASGIMFSYTDLPHNIAGVVLLMFADFCDSTDGQMARLSGKKTLIGRMLDGFSGDVWFFFIYAAIALRLQDQYIPGTDIRWSFWIWILVFIAGVLSHSPQASLADYYRQIHLYFLKGKGGSELDTYVQQRAIYESLPKSAHMDRAFYFSYSNYCKSQERRTPRFQTFFANWKNVASLEENNELAPVRQQFLDGSRRLMPFTNLLTFNSRAICLYITALLNCPWVYILFEIIVLNGLYVYMHKKHEKLCERMNKQLLATA